MNNIKNLNNYTNGEGDYLNDYNSTKILTSFCEKEDLIGKAVFEVFEVFKNWCIEENIISPTPQVFGKYARKVFGIGTRKMRVKNKGVFSVFVNKENDYVRKN